MSRLGNLVISTSRLSPGSRYPSASSQVYERVPELGTSPLIGAVSSEEGSASRYEYDPPIICFGRALDTEFSKLCRAQRNESTERVRCNEARSL